MDVYFQRTGKTPIFKPATVVPFTSTKDIVYSKEVFRDSARKNNSGPIGYIKVGKLPCRDPS